MSYVKYLQLDRPAAGVCRVLLDRPASRNAINVDMVEELHEALSGCTEPALFLGSTDGRSFCSGGDLSLEPEVLKQVSSRLYDLYLEMLRLDSVIVAAVNGTAIGAGAQMLLACDVRIGAPGVRVSFAGVGSGLALGTWGLPSLVGRGRAVELSLSGRAVDGDEAARIGLLDRLVLDPGAEALSLCELVATARPGLSLRVKSLVRSPSSDLATRLAAERDANANDVHVAAGSRSSER
jgi:enoyl-CoA hydratase/carnithine racemase